MIRGILFDKDGTLIEFASVWHAIVGEILEKFSTRYQVSEGTLRIIREASGYLPDGFSKESIIQYGTTDQIARLWTDIIGKKEPEHPVSYEQVFALMEEGAVSEQAAFPPVSGVRELLPYLKSRGYYLGVSTSDTEKSTLHSLKKAGILSFFDKILSSDGGLAPKPAPDGALAFCAAGGFSPSDALMVGDSITDMEFAQNAGMAFAGLIAEYNDSEKLGESGAAVKQIGDIVRLFAL